MKENSMHIRTFFDERIRVDIPAYERISQRYDNDKECWVQREPEYMTVDHDDIIGIYPTTEEDLRSNISTNVEFPTEHCIMKIYDRHLPGSRRVLIAGSYDEWTRRWDNFQSKYYEIMKKYTVERWKLANDLQRELNEIIDKS